MAPRKNIKSKAPAAVKPARSGSGINQSTAATSDGSKQWRRGAQLLDGGTLGQMSGYDPNAGKFAQTVKVLDNDAFTLRTVIITEGPLAGRKAIVLDPITDHFRFLDLPPELRQIVYDLLLVEADPISLYMNKRAGGSTLGSERTGGTWPDPGFGLVATLLRVNKETHQEAASTVYGQNTFLFATLTVMYRFLEGFAGGNDKRYLRNLRLWTSGYRPLREARRAFGKLHDFNHLSSVTIDLETVCPEVHGKFVSNVVSIDQLIKDCTLMMRGLCKVRDADEALCSIRIGTWRTRPCDACVEGKNWMCERAKTGCTRVCGEVAEHCQELEQEFQAGMKVLGLP